MPPLLVSPVPYASVVLMDWFAKRLAIVPACAGATCVSAAASKWGLVIASLVVRIGPVSAFHSGVNPSCWLTFQMMDWTDVSLYQPGRPAAGAETSIVKPPCCPLPLESR